MSPLTTRKRRRRKVGVTRQSWDKDLSECQAILFAVRVANPIYQDSIIQQLTFDGRTSRRWRLSPQLRERTATELDAIASHDTGKQAQVMKRLFSDSPLNYSLEGRGYIDRYSRDKGIRWHWEPVIESPEQLVDYGILLLLDDSQPWGRRFFRCQLASCNALFIAPPPKSKGQFRFKYCSPEHQREADKAKSVERVTASRLGITVAEYRKRKHK